MCFVDLISDDVEYGGIFSISCFVENKLFLLSSLVSIVFIKTCVAGLVGIERHTYTKSRNDQIPCVCVCMYVQCICMCNYPSQTTEPSCIKIIPARRASYADYYYTIGYLDLKYLPPPYLEPSKKPKKGVNRHFQAKLA